MDLTRRAALALPALVTVGCTEGSLTPRPAAVDPDAALVAAAVGREQALLQAYALVASRQPAAARLLAALRRDHEAHLLALAGAAPTATPGPTVTPTPQAVTLPQPTVAAVRQLLRTTEQAHAAAVLEASPRLAPVLASLAACEASHLAVL